MALYGEMAVFAQVVDCGSFSAAARRLEMTTSAVSRHVSRLEQALGGRLLQRSTRALALTELGRDVHAACLRMTHAARDVHALADRYGERPTGTIRVSAPVVFGQACIAPLLPAFLDAHAEVQVQLSLTDRPVDLIAEAVDVAVRIASALPPGLAARPLCRVDFALVAAPAYLARHAAPAAPRELAAHRLIHLGDVLGGDTWVLRRGEETVEVVPNARATMDHSGAIVAMAEAAGGIGLVPAFAARASLAAGRLVGVLAAWRFDAPHAGDAHLVYTPGRHQALKVRAFMDHLVRHLGE